MIFLEVAKFDDSLGVAKRVEMSNDACMTSNGANKTLEDGGKSVTDFTKGMK